MPGQRRGEETKERILEEACRVFAERGFRDATHAEICRRAGVNIAAINYYFASKDNLYRSAFDYMTKKAEALYPLDGGLPGTVPARERLRAFVHAFISRAFDTERLGNIRRIMMYEMLEPTGLLAGEMEKRLARDRRHLLGMLREIAGPEMPQRTLEWCEMSLIGQCFMVMRSPGGDDRGPHKIFGLHAAAIEALAEHILAFSLGGIAAVHTNLPPAQPRRARKNRG